ncbi:MAG: hypothetical protein HY539_00635 [Deltaproteobacteria bacterium]|nr:hypothetical protein [Deltaproteobacteria bacterium]
MNKRFLLLLIFMGVGVLLGPAPVYPYESRSDGQPVVVPRSAQKLLPDISLIGTVAAAYFSDEPAGETGHDPARSGFTLQEIEIAFQSVIDPYLRGDLFLSFQEVGVELEEGYVTTLGLIKGLQIRGGKFLLPFGRQNQKHLETWDFANLPLVNKYLLGPENLSELGAEISCLLPTPFFLQLQGTFSNGENETSFGGGRPGDFVYQGRVSTGFDTSKNTTILLGTSAASGFNDTGLGNQTRLFGGDFLFKWKPASYRSVTWQSEYIYRWRQAGTLTEEGGLYSYVDYQFLKRWHLGMRYDQMGLPEDAIVKEWRAAPTVTFNPTEFSRIRLQYEYDKPSNGRRVHAAFLQLEFSMGPHGVHAF